MRPAHDLATATRSARRYREGRTATSHAKPDGRVVLSPFWPRSRRLNVVSARQTTTRSDGLSGSDCVLQPVVGCPKRKDLRIGGP